jgi:hypothetical protein
MLTQSVPSAYAVTNKRLDDLAQIFNLLSFQKVTLWDQYTLCVCPLSLQILNKSIEFHEIYFEH